jgi:hypothetical protein
VLGDPSDAASRLVGALSSADDLPSTSTELPLRDLQSSNAADPRGDDVVRYRAVVSALLDVRPDHVGGYFDEALDAALAANRVDVHLARTLRWWQRASVRAAEDFVVQIMPTVMAALDHADITAERDAAANAIAWQQALAIAELSAAVSPRAENEGAESDEADVSDAGVAVSWKSPVRLVAVPDLAVERPASQPATSPVRRATRVRAARMPDFDAPIADVSIDEIDSMVTFEREDPRGHAHPASSA